MTQKVRRTDLKNLASPLPVTYASKATKAADTMSTLGHVGPGCGATFLQLVGDASDRGHAANLPVTTFNTTALSTQQTMLRPTNGHSTALLKP